MAYTSVASSQRGSSVSVALVSTQERRSSVVGSTKLMLSRVPQLKEVLQVEGMICFTQSSNFSSLGSCYVSLAHVECSNGYLYANWFSNDVIVFCVMLSQVDYDPHFLSLIKILQLHAIYANYDPLFVINELCTYV